VAKSITYYNPSINTTWTAVYWEWPIETDGHEEYERIVLNASSAGAVAAPALPASTDPVVGLQFALASLLQGSSGQINDPQLVATRDLLLGFAHAIVTSRASAVADVPR
jgi:hypothetical protein